MLIAFKVTGTVVLLISVAGRQSQCLFRRVLSDEKPLIWFKLSSCGVLLSFQVLLYEFQRYLS